MGKFDIGAPAPQQAVLKPSLSDGKLEKCKKCEGTVFSEEFMLVKLSKLLTGTDKDQMVPIPVIVCSGCGKILEESIPKEVLELQKKK